MYLVLRFSRTCSQFPISFCRRASRFVAFETRAVHLSFCLARIKKTIAQVITGTPDRCWEQGILQSPWLLAGNVWSAKKTPNGANVSPNPPLLGGDNSLSVFLCSGLQQTLLDKRLVSSLRPQELGVPRFMGSQHSSADVKSPLQLQAASLAITYHIT